MNRIQRVRRFRLAPLALSVVAVLAVSLPAAAPALAAGNATVSVTPAAQPGAGPGSTFDVQVISNASVTTSGIQASVTFEKQYLQITAVTRPGTGWGTAVGTAGVFLGPTGDLTVAANLAAAISAANASGTLATVAANLTPSTPPAAPNVLSSGVDQGFLNITFRVIACPAAGGTTPIGLPVGPNATTMLDAAGDVVAVTTAGSVVTPCVGNSGNTTTHVTSSFGAGYLALEVPSAVSIPLARQTTNVAEVPVRIFSDGPWTLNLQDAMPSGKLAGDRGHMTDAIPATKRIAAPMQAYVTPFDTPPGALVRTLDQPAANTNLTTSSGNASPVVVLTQDVGPSDPPASYRIVLLFTATSGF